MKDYIFTYEGVYDTDMFICSAANGDEAMKKFIKYTKGEAIIIGIEIKENQRENGQTEKGKKRISRTNN